MIGVFFFSLRSTSDIIRVSGELLLFYVIKWKEDGWQATLGVKYYKLTNL